MQESIITLKRNRPQKADALQQREFMKQQKEDEKLDPKGISSPQDCIVFQKYLV
jgi:hypothetical protein